MVGTFIADDLKIPVIINNPGSFELYDFTGTFLPASKNMNQCCGCICLRRKAPGCFRYTLARFVFNSSVRFRFW